MLELPERVFLALFAAAIAATLVGQLWRGGSARAGALLKAFIQLPLFILAVYLAYHSGALDRRLVSLVEIFPGLAAGHLIFVASVLATHGSREDARTVLVDLRSLWQFFVNNPNLALRTIQLSFTEELIYRAVFQVLMVALLGPWPGVLLTAALFAVSHEHVFKNTLRETAEFVAFSLLLGSVYYATSSLAAVVAIHAVRNFEIAELEFSARAHELGSEEAAQREFDQKYRQESAQTS